MNKKQNILYGLGVLALGLQVAALSTEKWSVLSSDENMGLWDYCMKGQCVSLPPNSDNSFPKNALHAVRAFAVMSAVFLFLALMNMYDNSSKIASPLRLLFAAGVSSIAAMAIWSTQLHNYKGVKYEYGYSFHFNWAAGLLALLAAGYLYRK